MRTCKLCGVEVEGSKRYCKKCRFERALIAEKKGAEKKTRRNIEYLKKVKLARGCDNCGYKDNPDNLIFQYKYPSLATTRPITGYTSIKKIDEKIKLCYLFCKICQGNYNRELNKLKEVKND